MSTEWVTVLDFVVPGQPVPKARPRFARTRRGVRTYTSARTSVFESKVALFAGTAGRWTGYLAPEGVPVRVDVLAVFERPRRLSRKKDAPGLLEMAKRPDIDNVVKAVLDGLSTAGVRVFHDDGQVQVIRAEKVYAEKGQGPRTVIRVYVPKERAADGEQKMDARPARLDTPSG